MSARAAARWPLLVAGVAALCYANTVGLGFALDDVPIVRDDPGVHRLARVPSLFARPYWNVPGEQHGLYRPATAASFAVNRAVFGPEPSGFHVVNVALHALVSALVWFALRRAGTHYGTALIGALLFATHPVHTEAVANVVGRSEMLAAAGVLGAWLLHRRAVDDPAGPGRARLLGAAAACYLAAVLSKEGAVLAPALFFADDLMRRGAGGRPGRDALNPLAAYGVALAIALALRVLALGGLRGAESAVFLDNPAAFAGTFARVATSIWTAAMHLGQFFWPARLVSDYSFDALPAVISAADPRLGAGLAAIAAVAAATAWAWRRSRPVAIGLVAWAAFSLPSSNLLFATGTIYSERAAYLPSLGLCLVIAHAGAAAAGRRGPARIAVVAATVAVILALAGRTVSRNPAWRDNGTLAIRDVEVQPRSAKLQAGAALALEEAGRPEQAEERLRRAVALWPDYHQARYNLAVLLARRGAEVEAIGHLRTIAQAGSMNPRPYALLGALLEKAGRTDEARSAYARAASLDPSDAGTRRRFERLGGQASERR